MNPLWLDMTISARKAILPTLLVVAVAGPLTQTPETRPAKFSFIAFYQPTLVDALEQLQRDLARPAPPSDAERAAAIEALCGNLNGQHRESCEAACEAGWPATRQCQLVRHYGPAAIEIQVLRVNQQMPLADAIRQSGLSPDMANRYVQAADIFHALDLQGRPVPKTPAAEAAHKAWDAARELSGPEQREPIYAAVLADLLDQPGELGLQAYAHHLLGIARYQLKQYESAATPLRQASDSWDELLGPGNSMSMWALPLLAECLLMIPKPAGALAVTDRFFEQSATILGPAHRDSVDRRVTAFGLYDLQNQHERALELAPKIWSEAGGLDGPPAELSWLVTDWYSSAKTRDPASAAQALRLQPRLALRHPERSLREVVDAYLFTSKALRVFEQPLWEDRESDGPLHKSGCGHHLAAYVLSKLQTQLNTVWDEERWLDWTPSCQEQKHTSDYLRQLLFSSEREAPDDINLANRLRLRLLALDDLSQDEWFHLAGTVIRANSLATDQNLQYAGAFLFAAITGDDSNPIQIPIGFALATMTQHLGPNARRSLVARFMEYRIAVLTDGYEHTDLVFTMGRLGKLLDAIDNDSSKYKVRSRGLLTASLGLSLLELYGPLVARPFLNHGSLQSIRPRAWQLATHARCRAALELEEFGLAEDACAQARAADAPDHGPTLAELRLQASTEWATRGHRQALPLCSPLLEQAEPRARVAYQVLEVCARDAARRGAWADALTLYERVDGYAPLALDPLYLTGSEIGRAHALSHSGQCEAAVPAVERLSKRLSEWPGEETPLTSWAQVEWLRVIARCRPPEDARAALETMNWPDTEAPDPHWIRTWLAAERLGTELLSMPPLHADGREMQARAHTALTALLGPDHPASKRAMTALNTPL